MLELLIAAAAAVVGLVVYKHAWKPRSQESERKEIFPLKNDQGGSQDERAGAQELADKAEQEVGFFQATRRSNELTTPATDRTPFEGTASDDEGRTGSAQQKEDVVQQVAKNGGREIAFSEEVQLSENAMAPPVDRVPLQGALFDKTEAAQKTCADSREVPPISIAENVESSHDLQNRFEAAVDRADAECQPRVYSHGSLWPGERPQGESEEVPQVESQKEEAQSFGPVQLSEIRSANGRRTNSSRVKPEERGGRPRTAQHEREKQSGERIARQPKPEIVCWKEGWQWTPGVELPEGLPTWPTVTILQDREPLAPDQSRPRCWLLRQLSGAVLVSQCDQQSGSTTIPLSEEFLLIKLTKRTGSDEGRLVRTASWGSYLVIVPEGWTRDESLSGPAPVDPEPVCVPGYQAHFFNRDRAVFPNKIAFRTPEQRLVEIPSSAPKFELVGNQLPVTNQAMAPLFGGAPPTIRALDGNAWSNVGTIVVGEEGGGCGRWRATFEPREESIEQGLPPEVANRKGGWYFLRLYDRAEGLLDSIDFRFLSALKAVRVLEPLRAIPCNGRQKSVRVELVHELGCQVMPVDGSSGRVQIERLGDRTVLLQLEMESPAVKIATTERTHEQPRT